jgi:hypothetical protein
VARGYNCTVLEVLLACLRVRFPRTSSHQQHLWLWVRQSTAGQCLPSAAAAAAACPVLSSGTLLLRCWWPGPAHAACLLGPLLTSGGPCRWLQPGRQQAGGLGSGVQHAGGEGGAGAGEGGLSGRSIAAWSPGQPLSAFIKNMHTTYATHLTTSLELSKHSPQTPHKHSVCAGWTSAAAAAGQGPHCSRRLHHSTATCVIAPARLCC